MSMRNLYAGKCFICGKDVQPKQGFFQAVGGMNKAQKKHWNGVTWLVRCTQCVGKHAPSTKEELKELESKI